MATPNYHAVTQGSTFSAGDINQLLGTHAITYLNQGTQKETGAASATGFLASNTGSAAQYIDQPFTTVSGQTTITRVEFNLLIVGSGADTTLSLYANSGGNPTGAALYSVTFPLDFLPGIAAYVSVPFNVSGLSASTLYHIVMAGTASTSNYIKWQDGTTVHTQAQTSPTGVGGTWTAAGKETLFNVYNGTNGVLRNTYEDGGARWTGLDYNSSNGNTTVATVREYTTGTIRSVRALSYVGGALVGVA